MLNYGVDAEFYFFGALLEHGDTPRKYTVYAIGTDGRMIVGDVTV